MGYETYANHFITSLSGNGGAITSGTTTINIASGTGAPLGQSRFLIDTELIIGSVTGTVLTATTRGAEGTTAAAHNDGATVSCVLTAASLLLAEPSNEAQAGMLVNAASTGDAGKRSTHFTEGALPAGWTATGQSGGSGPAGYGKSVLSAIAGSDKASYMGAYTPSGNFRIEARVKVAPQSTTGGNGAIAFGVSDSTNLVGGNPNSVLAYWSPNAPDESIYTQDGSGIGLTRRVGSTGAIYAASWLYIALYRTGSNFFMDTSIDRVSWLNQGGAYSRSLTVATIGIFIFDRSMAAYDFLDVVS